MARLEKRSYQKSRGFIYPVNAAERFIDSFYQSEQATEEQRTMLAAAYYTLATQKNISINLSKMHINSAITLLKNIQSSSRKKSWYSQIAHAYFKRAELQEETGIYSSACLDYQCAIEALEKVQEPLAYACISEKRTLKTATPFLASLNNYDRLLLSQSAISIADLIVNEQIHDAKNSLSHPLFYINKALEQLSEITEINDDIWKTEAYAHQIAGIALSDNHFEASKEAFLTALSTVYCTESLSACSFLSDIYTCLGLLYEHQYQNCPIQKSSYSFIEHAMIYFGLAMMFIPTEVDTEKDDDVLSLESLFEMVYRVLDPFLSPLSSTVIHNLIDALVYAYLCCIEDILPNRILAEQLSHPEILDTFAQHICWLVIEAYRKAHPGAGLLEISEPNNSSHKLHWQDICNLLENKLSNNVYYLDDLKFKK